MAGSFSQFLYNETGRNYQECCHFPQDVMFIHQRLYLLPLLFPIASLISIFSGATVFYYFIYRFAFIIWGAGIPLLCWSNSLWSASVADYTERRTHALGMFVLTLYTLTSLCIFSTLFSIHFLRCWQGEFVSQSRASLVCDHFFYSHDLNVWFQGETVRRNFMLVTLRGKRVNLGQGISTSY